MRSRCVFADAMWPGHEVTKCSRPLHLVVLFSISHYIAPYVGLAGCMIKARKHEKPKSGWPILGFRGVTWLSTTRVHRLVEVCAPPFSNVVGRALFLEQEACHVGNPYHV